MAGIMNLLCYVIGHNYGPTETTGENGLIYTKTLCERRGCTIGIGTCRSADGDKMAITEAQLLELIGRGLKVTVDGKRVKVAK